MLHMAISTHSSSDASNGKTNSSAVGQRQDGRLKMLSFQYSGPPFSEQEFTGTLFVSYPISIPLSCCISLHDIIPDIVYDIVYDFIKRMMLLVQDCVCVVAPYTFSIEPLEDFDPIGDSDVTGGGDVWNARPLLFFTCTLCPTGLMGDTTSHKDVSLVFFNTFDPSV